MTDDASELLEIEVDMLVNKAHNSDLNYWQILKVFLAHCVTLQMKADIEYYIKLKE